MNSAMFPDGPADDARPQDVELYAAMLTFTRQRLQHADGLLAEPPYHRVKIETCALQVRLSLEQIVLSTLVSNRPEVAAIASAFAKKDVSEVRRLVKKVNPRYWPIPFEFRKVEEGRGGFWKMEKPSEPYLREDEWGKAYGYCSTLLHATNPYQYLLGADADGSQVSQLPDHMKRLKSLSSKLQTLIRSHQVYLSEIDHSFICKVPDDTSVRPKIEVWKRMRPNLAGDLAADGGD